MADHPTGFVVTDPHPACDMLDGLYGSFALRCSDRVHWSCYESSDYHFYAVMDDFGYLQAVTHPRNLRGY